MIDAFPLLKGAVFDVAEGLQHSVSSKARDTAVESKNTLLK